MKHTLVILALVCFSSSAFAQIPTRPVVEQQSSAIPSVLTESLDASDAVLPDSPRPVVSSQEPVPCPAGVGRPCALLGGMRFYPVDLTQHEKSWWDGMSKPSMIFAACFLIGGTLLDVITTQKYANQNGLRESNLLFGQHPSPARIWGTAMPLLGFQLYLQGKMKKDGHGVAALVMSTGSGLLHAYLAHHNWALANEKPAHP
jgi:hypothetical protein